MRPACEEEDGVYCLITALYYILALTTTVLTKVRHYSIEWLYTARAGTVGSTPYAGSGKLCHRRPKLVVR